MASKRHVPLIMGIVGITAAFAVLWGFSGWWRYIPATILFAFGWVSIKTALFASAKEIRDLTGTGPASEDTLRKLKDRL